MTFSERVQSLRKGLGLSQEAFAREFQDYTIKAVAKWEQGGTKRAHPDACLRMAQLSKQIGDSESESFFLGLAGKPSTATHSPGVRVVTKEEWKAAAEDHAIYQVELPVIADPAELGFGLEINEADVKTYISIPSEVAHKGPGKYWGLRTKGHSMEPAIADGMIVVVDPDNRSISRLRGKVVAVTIETAGRFQTVIKYLARESKPDRIVLHSANPEFQDIVVESQEQNPIRGEVIFLWGAPALERA